jgi:hypothetical protein
MLKLQLDRTQRQKFRDALLDAFRSRSDLRQMVSYGLDERLDEIAGTGNLKDTVFELIDWAEAEGKTDELLIAARHENPGNPKLLAFAAEAGFTAMEPSQGQAERIVNTAAKFQDVETFLARLRACENAVCRIETPRGNGVGTGFLLGPDLVMTNYHVMEGAIRGTVKQETVVFRFGYKVEADGLTLRTGQEYCLVAGNGWLVDSSPLAALDYALVRLAGKAGEDPADGGMGTPQRGWLTPVKHDFVVGEPLYVLQHPDAAPLKFADGSVTEVWSAKNRVIYRTNTIPGSSGSPCFDGAWELVALHHWGDPAGNRGVIFSAILVQPKVSAALGQ